MRAFTAIRYIAAVGIGTRIGALDITDAITGCPLANENAAIDIISRRPDSGESENQSEFVTLILAEHLANGVGIAPQVFGVVTLNLFAVFCRQQQVLDIAVVSVHLQRADTFVFFAG